MTPLTKWIKRQMSQNGVMFHTFPLEFPGSWFRCWGAAGEMQPSSRMSLSPCRIQACKITVLYANDDKHKKKKNNPSGIIIQITYGITEACLDFLISGRIFQNATTRVWAKALLFYEWFKVKSYVELMLGICMYRHVREHCPERLWLSAAIKKQM